MPSATEEGKAGTVVSPLVPELEFRILGPLEVVRAEESVKLRGRKQQTLLAVLLLNANRVVSVDYLADQLWAESAPGNPGAVLHVHVSNLRRMLGDHCRTGRKIVTTDTGYVLRVDPNQIDARTFERLAGEASAALAQDQPQEAWNLLTAALDLWRGPAFGDLSFEKFAQAEAVRLEELRMGVVEDQMESALALGRHCSVVAELQSLVRANPLRERLRAQLMIGLYRCGRQVDALAVYDRGRRMLGEELGVDPSPMLRSVHEDILQQAARLEWKPPSIKMLPAPFPEGAEMGPGQRGDLIGREKELSHLREWFLEAFSGHPSVVLVEGERGVGKSRLAQAFAHSCGTSAEVVWASCWETGASPVYWPWTQLVRRLLERSEPAPSDAAASPAAAELAAIVPELRLGLPGDPAPGCQEDAARFRLYASVVRLLVRLAAHKPLVLVLDDVHCADQPSLELLEFVAAELELLASQREQASILVLATYCAAEDPDGDLLGASLGGLSRRSMVARMTLKSLSLSDVGRLIKAVTGEDPSFDSVLAVHDRSAGNPFCIHELIRYLTARGDGPDALAPEVVRSALPPAVREIVTRRLARLPGRVLDLLRVAAVTGPSFSLPVVATVSLLDEELVLEILAPALRRSIVEEVPERIGHYRFGQVLVRDTLYAELSYGERRRLHRLVGQTLEGADNVPVFEIADHFWKAAPGNVTRALTYVERAADLAMARGAYDQAEAQLERALKLVQCLPRADRSKRELPLQLQLGLLVAMTRGDSDQRVLLASERARELCTEAGDLEHLLSGLWGLAHFHHATSDLPRARDIGQTMLDLGTEHGAASFVLAGRLTLGIVAVHNGELAEARDHLDAARQAISIVQDDSLIETFGHDPIVLSAGVLSMALWELGEHGRAIELTTGALALARRLAHPYTTVVALFSDSWLRVLARDRQGVRTRADEVGPASRHGSHLYQTLATTLRSWTMGQQAAVAAGSWEANPGPGSYMPTATMGNAPFHLALLAQVHRCAGRRDEGLEALAPPLPERAARGELLIAAELRNLRQHLLDLAVGPHGPSQLSRELRSC